MERRERLVRLPLSRGRRRRLQHLSCTRRLALARVKRRKYILSRVLNDLLEFGCLDDLPELRWRDMLLQSGYFIRDVCTVREVSK